MSQASRLEFRILGPLTVRVDGARVPIGGPKQRALLALLLLSANRVVSRDRLVDELFPGQSVESADHALRNHVSRLRKVFAAASADAPRLVARAPGYLLRVEPGELDLEQFERLAAAARGARAAGDPAAAVESLRAAERLWQGRPLADLEFEPFARLEIERLQELRLATVEERIEAELALGRQLAVIPELEVLAAEHPYRERFRAQLMLALYRAGRQAEGLAVYRQTRTLLNEELGLDPTHELQELERAMLLQDRALRLDPNGDRRRPPPSEVCPFKGLAPFEPDDAEFFFGRERLVQELVAQVTESQLLAIIGPSGSGKSSLLRAGVLPALGLEAHVLRVGDRPPVVPAGERIVIAVDQFEELFSPSLSEDERRAFVDALVDAAWDPDRRALVLIAVRADFFWRLAEYRELADLLAPNHVLLGPMTTAEVRRAIEGPAACVGLDVELALVDALVGDVAGEAGALPLLSSTLLELWEGRDGRTLTLEAYERTGGVRGVVGRRAEAAFASLPEDARGPARRVLLRLVAGGDGEALTRRRVTRRELDVENDEQVARVLAALVEQRLLVADHDTVELVHEALLDQWPRLRGWLEEDAQGRRLHRHLARAAADWEAHHRDPGDLYRGARLAATLEWAETLGEHAPLNRLEREFLRESRTMFVRATRRLRTLLAVAVLLLVVAVIAGAVALAARGSATRQATAAIAQRLGAQALLEPQLDRALLLAREGVALHDSVATQSNLLAALLRSPAALGVLHGGGTRVLDQALSPDGRTVVERDDDGSAAFFDTATLREVGERFQGTGQVSHFGAIVRPVRAVAFSPSGRTLAVGDSDGQHATIDLVDARTHRSRASVTSATDAVTADVAFSPDGRTLVTGEETTGKDLGPPEILVVRGAGDARELRRSKPVAAGRLVGFALGGRYLLVTSGETRSYLLDARTLRRARTFHVAGTPTIDATGEMAAFGASDGTVDLVALRSGRERLLGRGATGSVTSIVFSDDGNVVATGSDDGSIAVFDIRTRSLRETFAGHAGAVVGLAFSPDGTTLYSGSKDGTAIVWDVHGSRRLGQPFRFSPVAHGGAGVHVPPENASTAVAASADSAVFATSPAPDRVTVWRTTDQKVVGELHGPCGYVDELEWSHDGRFVGAACDRRSVVIWNVMTRKIVRLLGPTGPGGAAGLAFSPDDTLVAAAGADGLARVYDRASGRMIATFGDPPKTFQAADFSGDGKWLVAAGLGPGIFVWNVVDRRVERVIRDDRLHFAIKFSPHGPEFATGDDAGDVRFWDAATGQHVRSPLGGHNGAVVSVTYDPGGKSVITTSTDGKFRLWDLASGKLVGAPLPGADTGGWGTFFPDGKHVAAAFGSGTGVVWSVDPSLWKTTACRVAHRQLTRAEWREFLPERRYRRVCP